MNQTNGDTPTGQYEGVLGYHWDNVEVYGEYDVIFLTGVSGYIKEEANHRWGFLIHGGRVGYSDLEDPYYPLYPTEGCVRVTEEYQLALQTDIRSLQNNYHKDKGLVSVREVDCTCC